MAVAVNARAVTGVVDARAVAGTVTGAVAGVVALTAAAAAAGCAVSVPSSRSVKAVVEADRFSIRVATEDDTPSNMLAAWSAARHHGRSGQSAVAPTVAAGPALPPLPAVAGW